MKEPEEKTVYYPTGIPLDVDIQSTQKNLKDTEAKLGTWDLKPNTTIKASQKNATSHAQVGKWTPVVKKNAQAKKSDPICGSAGCPPPLFPLPKKPE